MPEATRSFGAPAHLTSGSAPLKRFDENTTIGKKTTLQMTIAPDFREFAASLNAREVRFLIVGGYAVAFHGHPRYTKDLDVWVDRSPENVERRLLALTDFGFGAVGLTSEDFLPANQLIQLGHLPLRIYLLTSVDGVEFDECFDTRISRFARG